MVLVEAMSCGLPVVSFACPCGPKDIVSDGEDGLLVESGNIDKLAEAMTKMIREDNLRTSMAQAALVNVERFRIERIAQQWKQLFTSL